MTLYKLVVFDLEGTLLDSMKFIMDVIHDFLEKEKQIVPDAIIKKGLGLSIPKFIEAIFPEYNLCERKHAEQLYTDTYYNFLSKRTYKLFDGVERVLDQLIEKNILISLASNAPDEAVDGVLSEVGLTHVFHSVITSSHAKPKPAPDMLLHLMKKHNLSPHEVLMVGDSLSDIDCAKAANVDCLGVAYNGVFDYADIIKLNPTLGCLLDIRDLPDIIF